jgi:hypothetical protein
VLQCRQTVLSVFSVHRYLFGINVYFPVLQFSKQHIFRLFATPSYSRPSLHLIFLTLSSALTAPPLRPSALSAKQEDMLNAFCSFMDKHLLPSSVEKRSVALKLSVELVRISFCVFADFFLSAH